MIEERKEGEEEKEKRLRIKGEETSFTSLKFVCFDSNLHPQFLILDFSSRTNSRISIMAGTDPFSPPPSPDGASASSVTPRTTLSNVRYNSKSFPLAALASFCREAMLSQRRQDQSDQASP